MSYSPPRTAHSMQSKQWCCNKQPTPGGAEEIKGEASSWQASLFVGYITSSLGVCVCSLLPAWKWSLSKQSLAHTVHMGRRKGTTRVQEGEEGTRRRGGGGEEGSRLSLRQLRPPCPGGNTLPCFLLVFSGLADAMNISWVIFVGPLRVHICFLGMSTQELTSLVCSSYSVSSFIQHISKRIICFHSVRTLLQDFLS